MTQIFLTAQPDSGICLTNPAYWTYKSYVFRSLQVKSISCQEILTPDAATGPLARVAQPRGEFLDRLLRATRSASRRAVV